MVEKKEEKKKMEPMQVFLLGLDIIVWGTFAYIFLTNIVTILLTILLLIIIVMLHPTTTKKLLGVLGVKVEKAT